MKPDWKWILWQVLVPLAGPSLVAAIVSLAWMSLDTSFEMKMGVIIDLTPWAVTFYSITLVGVAMDSLWTKLLAGAGANPKAPSRFLALFIVALSVVIYNAFIVIKRHDSTFTLHRPAYVVTIILVLASIITSYRGHKA